MIVLDTDMLTLVQRRAGADYARLAARLDAAKEPACVTIVSFEEQMRGWLTLMARSRTLQQQIQVYKRLRGLLEDFQTRPVLDFDEMAAFHYQSMVKSRVRIGTMDLRIAAAAALAHDATLLSRNLVDFRKVPRLRVEDWTAP